MCVCDTHTESQTNTHGRRLKGHPSNRYRSVHYGRNQNQTLSLSLSFRLPYRVNRTERLTHQLENVTRCTKKKKGEIIIILFVVFDYRWTVGAAAAAAAGTTATSLSPAATTTRLSAIRRCCHERVRKVNLPFSLFFFPTTVYIFN